MRLHNKPIDLRLLLIRPALQSLPLNDFIHGLFTSLWADFGALTAAIKTNLRCNIVSIRVCFSTLRSRPCESLDHWSLKTTNGRNRLVA